MPRDDRVEALVEVGTRPEGMEPDAVPELAQPLECTFARGRGEVVELAARHQEVGGRRAALGLELGDLERSVQREVDIVPQQDVPRLGRPIEEGEAIPARAGGR